MKVISPRARRHLLGCGAGGRRLGEESLDLDRRCATGSKRCLEFFDRKPGVSHDPGHSESLHGVVARYGHEPLAVAHDDVPALSHNPESSFLERTYRIEMVDPRNSRHG